MYGGAFIYTVSYFTDIIIVHDIKFIGGQYSFACQQKAEDKYKK